VAALMLGLESSPLDEAAGWSAAVPCPGKPELGVFGD